MYDLPMVNQNWATLFFVWANAHFNMYYLSKFYYGVGLKQSAYRNVVVEYVKMSRQFLLIKIAEAIFLVTYTFSVCFMLTSEEIVPFSLYSFMILTTKKSLTG